MISVIPCFDKEKLKELYLKNDTEFSDASSAVLAESSGEILGFCLFDLYEKSALIKKIEPENDIMLADGILRSALHVVSERFITEAHYDKSIFGIVNRLEFVKDKNERTLDTDKLFKSCKSCK